MRLLELLVHLAPLLALLAPLLLGRYPGERGLRERLSRPSPLPRPRTSPPRPRRYPRRPRGGALLAYALAGRAPPATAP